MSLSMQGKVWIARLGGFFALGFVILTPPSAHSAAGGEESEGGGPDPVELEERAIQVLDSYCVSCHGPDKQKGGIRFDLLESIDAVDRQALFGQVEEVMHLEEMPPVKAKQPSGPERKLLQNWVTSQLTGKSAQALAEKLKRFEYGNAVPHDDLFSGEHADLPSNRTFREPSERSAKPPYKNPLQKD